MSAFLPLSQSKVPLGPTFCAWRFQYCLPAESDLALDMANGKPQVPLLLELLWELASQFQVKKAVASLNPEQRSVRDAILAWLEPVTAYVKIGNLSKRYDPI